ncbi:hypothetical protein RZN05_18040 [Sphingomonas sp. HF-S4]|uniref:Uncharacterized protein n=1 Tax=Sphingomonas agrestis TaxID=3080540 RepID=A0ABU3YBY0_9SPHN|nr:hypothetical protein [Sphingomonas sp. HF-S4]MDV3458904.1 hypothetical protein [Sphingomonas sp. HF-S4]
MADADDCGPRIIGPDADAAEDTARPAPQGQMRSKRVGKDVTGTGEEDCDDGLDILFVREEVEDTRH